MNTKKEKLRKVFVYVDYTNEETPRAFYVGKGLKKRVKSLKRENDHHKSICKLYGIQRVIIYETFDDKHAREIEILKIKEFHTFYSDPDYNQFGCNATLGGDGCSGWHHSQEFIDRMKINMSGENSPSYGTHLSQQHLDIIRCPVTQYDLSGNKIKDWESLTAAARSLNFSGGTIGGCCRKELKTAGGFIWRFVGDELTQQETDNCRNIKLRRVAQYSLDGKVLLNIFNSLSGAARSINYKGSGIVSCCQGKQKNAGKFLWRYVDDINNVPKEIIPPVPKHIIRRKVIKLDLNDVEICRFNSIQEAAKITSTNRTTIICCCQGKNKLANGYKWKYAD
jgi:hypothetical protein